MVDIELANLVVCNPFVTSQSEALTCARNSLVGSTIDDIPAWNAQTQRQIHLFGRFGITIFALSGVDIALWDLASKRAGLPLCKLLNSENTGSSIPFCASLVRYGERALATDALEDALRCGFSSIKLHEIVLDEIEACRSVLGSDRR